MKSQVLRLLGAAALASALAGPALADPSITVTVGQYTAIFSVACNDCSGLVLSQDGGNLGVTLTDSPGPLVTSPYDLTVFITAAVSKNGQPVPVIGGQWSITGQDDGGYDVNGGITVATQNQGNLGAVYPDPGYDVLVQLGLALDPGITSSTLVTDDDLSAYTSPTGPYYITSFTEDLLVATPEPATAGLMLVGLGALLARRRRRAVGV